MVTHRYDGQSWNLTGHQATALFPPHAAVVAQVVALVALAAIVAVREAPPGVLVQQLTQARRGTRPDAGGEVGVLRAFKDCRREGQDVVLLLHKSHGIWQCHSKVAIISLSLPPKEESTHPTVPQTLSAPWGETGEYWFDSEAQIAYIQLYLEPNTYQ